MKKTFVVLLLLLGCLIPTAVWASDISDADYYGIITISNNGTDATNVSTDMTLNTQNLINGDYSNSGATNLAITTTTGVGVAFMPGANSSYPWIIYVSAINANAYQSNLLYTADSSGGKIRYFPDVTGFTASDNDSLELGDNWTLSITGQLDMAGTTSTSSVTIRPDGVGATGDNLKAQPGAGSNYEEVDEAVSDNDTTYVYWDETSEKVDVYTLGDTSTEDNEKITAVTVSAVWKATAVSATKGYLEAAIRDGGAYYYGDKDEAADTNYNTYTHEWAISPATGLEWTWANIDDLQAGILMYPPHAAGVPSGESRCTQVYVTVSTETKNYIFYKNGAIEVQVNTSQEIEVSENDTALITASGITTGEQNLRITQIPNLLEYSSFEDGNPPTGWTAGGAGVSWNRTAAQAYAGTYSGILTRSGTDCYAYQDYFVAGMAGKPVSAGAWVKATEANAVKIRLADGINPYVDSSYHTGSGDWEWLSVEATLDAGASEANFVFWIADTDTTAYIDGAYATDAEDAPTDYNTLRLYIDGAERDTAYTELEVPDNTSTWQFIINRVMHWMQSCNITVGGTQVMSINWELNDSSFSDDSGHNNNVTPSFLSDSSDSDVTATLSYFYPISEAKADAYTLASQGDQLDTPEASSNFSTGLSGKSFPGAAVIDAIANASDTPAQIIYLVPWLMICLVGGFGLAYGMKKYGQVSLILLTVFLVGMFGIGLALGNIVDLWMVLLFVIYAITILIASRQQVGI